jgi:hypothetical protein
MATPIKSWLKSYILGGYGIMPLGNGEWLDEKRPPDKGTLVFPFSVLFPIARLRLIPSAFEEKFFQKIKKVLVAKGFLKSIGTLLVLGPIVNELGSVESDMIGYNIFITVCILGLLVPELIFIFKTRSLIRKNTIKVKLKSNLQPRFIFFNIIFIFFAAVYGFLKGFMEISAGSFFSDFVDELIGTTKDTVPEFFVKKKGEGLAGILAVIFKTVFSIIPLALISYGLLWLCEVIQNSGPAIITLMIFLFLVSLVWSLIFFVVQEKKVTK